jgi:hypothetical protein
MGIGPLESFAFPGVFTRTVNQSSSVSAAGDIRYPAIIGVAAEEERISDYEMVRGSSAIADNVIVDEDVSSQFDGSNKNFTVANFPIVRGDGKGTVSDQPTEVLVTINGEVVAVNSVDGLNGIVTLVTIPEESDTVRISYYYKRRDTFIENEDISEQVADGVTTFKVKSTRIVKGDNGGISATNVDIGQVVTFLYNPDEAVAGDEFERTVKILEVKVDGTPVNISEIDGANATFKLTNAVTAGQTVTVSYFTNTWQNTFDILPAPVINRIIKIGNSSDTSDYSVGSDAMLSGSNKLHWGHSAQAETGIYTPGSDPLEGNVITSLTDVRVYGRLSAPATPALDGNGDTITDSIGRALNDDSANNKTFILPTTPVDGTGTGIETENFGDGPDSDTNDDIIAYVGPDWETAKASGPVTISKVSGREVTLATVVPSLASEDKVFVTYYENNLVDDIWTLTNKVPGGVGVGIYTISSRLNGYAVPVTQQGGTATPVYAGSGAYNVEVNPIVAAVERVTLTFDGVGGFTVTSQDPNTLVAGKTGSVTANDGNKGYLGQTYIDPTTQFRITLDDATFSPSAGSTLIYDIGNASTTVASDKYDIDVDTNILKMIPGVNITVATTDGGAIDNSSNTVIINTYNKSGNEPAVGDYYYVTFDKARLDYTARFLTNMRDVKKFYGPLTINNSVVVAANLAFLNGAQAVAIKQVQRVAGGTDASVQDYIDAIDEFNAPMSNGTRPSLMQPLSTNPQIHSYLKTSNAIQSSIRYRNERTSIIGFAQGTKPDDVINAVSSLGTEKLTAIYPDSAVVELEDTFGNSVEYLVDGSMIAAALAGRDVSPVNDIATSLTNKTITGIKRLSRRLDGVTAAQVANAGCTVLQEETPVIRILMYLTTDMSDVLTRNPRVVEVKHYVQQGMRRVLRKYIGNKNLPRLIPQVRDTVNSYFRGLQDAEIISAYQKCVVEVNDQDPSTLDVEIFYSPVLPLNWIVVTLNLGITN